MIAVRDYVRLHPGCSKREVSLALYPHASQPVRAWKSIQRAIRDGLIRAVRGSHGYQLYVSDEWRDRA